MPLQDRVGQHSLRKTLAKVRNLCLLCAVIVLKGFREGSGCVEISF